MTPVTVPHPTAATLHQLIASSARRWRRLAVFQALLGVAAPLLACFLVAVGLDSVLHLPVAGRVMVHVALMVVAALLIVVLVRRLRSLQLSEDVVALAIERQTPGGLQNRLINTLQLSRRTGGDGNGDGAALTDAVVRENCVHLGRAVLPPAARSRPAIIGAGVAGGVVLVGLALFLWQPAGFLRSATRLLLPLASVEPAYRTTLIVEPGDIEAAGDVPLRIAIQGERPLSLTIRTDGQGQRDSIVVPVPEDADEVHHVLSGISRSLTYSVRGNDFTSPTYHLTVPTPTALTFPPGRPLSGSRWRKSGRTSFAPR